MKQATARQDVGLSQGSEYLLGVPGKDALFRVV